jgi:hypothetical protein
LSIAKRWSRFTWDKLDEVPDIYGVYELADGNHYTIYIGRGRLLDRLNYWKRKNDPCIMQARFFRYEELFSEKRCRQRERALLDEYKRIYGKLPRCNKRKG